MPTYDPLPPPPKRYDIRKLDYIWSVFLAVGVLAILFGGIDYAAASKGKDGDARLASLTVLPTEELGAPSWQRNLHAWIILRDPTIISLPNDRYGFSSVLRLGFQRPLETLPYDDVRIVHLPPNPFPDRNVAMPVINPRDSVIAARLREPLALPAIEEPTALPPGVYWTYPDGRPFDRLEPLDLVAVLGEGPFTVQRPTVLTTLPRGRLVRVRLDRTSGNAEVDQAAVDHLRRVFTTFSDIEPPTENMRWWLSEPHTFVIHWRHAPNVTTAANPVSPEDWHDHGWF